MNNTKLIAQLLTLLFEAEHRRLAAVITELNTQNKRLKATMVDGFLYGGTLYMPTNVSTTVNGPGEFKPGLHFSLNREMDEWVRDKKCIRDDQDLVKQMLFKLLKPCNSEREIRSALPECLVGLVQALSMHPRSAEAGYTLIGDERAHRQFLKLLPKMETYSVGKLFY